MDLATETAALVAAFLSSVGQRAGEAMVDKLAELYHRVKTAVQDHGFAEQALERLAARPEDQHRRASVADALAELIESDPHFAASLARLVADARLAVGGTMISESGAVAQDDLIMEGGYVAGRDLHIGQPSRWADEGEQHRA